MYFWNSYPFIRFTIALIFGIVVFDSHPSFWMHYEIVLMISIVCLTITILFAKKHGYYKLRHLNGFLAIFILFIIGGSIAKLRNASHSSIHYKNIQSSIQGYKGVIISPPNERTNHIRFDFNLESVILSNDSIRKTNGKIHLYIRKDSSNVSFNYGDRLLVFGKFYTVPGPDNPNEFDYRQYLTRQNIYSHSFVREENIRFLSASTPNFFLKKAYQLRHKASLTIDNYIPSPRENGIAKALLLGIKDYLDNDLKKAYSAAGAMHVLAVSGLHVGIIFLIVQVLFGKIRHVGKSGRYIFGIISVVTIWLYACLTGLSPSVLRAATMFSFISIGQFSKSQGNVYNTLGFSAFVLLLFDPNLIYSVGFQLSYAAVIGIVYIQPILYRKIHFNSWILDKAWAITCVSIAAQLATFPLSAYYFHQFPTYFLVSNLVVIPSSFLMLVSGISMIIIDLLLSPLSELIGNRLSQFIWLLNEVISLVHQLPKSLIEWIYIDRTSLILIYVIVISFISSFHFRSFKTMIFSSGLFILLLSWVLLSQEIQSRKRELVLYEISNTTAIDYIDGHKSSLFIDNYEKEDLELLAFQINPYRLASHLQPIQETLIDSILVRKDNLSAGIIGGKRFILFDTTTYHLAFSEKIITDFILINNQAVKNLKWLSQHFQFDQIIIGNTNSLYYSRKMKNQAALLKINLHSLKEDGALRVSLNEGIKKERTLLSAPFTTNPD